MKLYFPAFFSTSNEIQINKKLRRPEILAWDNKDYKNLWALKKHAERVAASIHQLESFVGDDETLKVLNQYATTAFERVIAGNKLDRRQHINPLNNTLYRLKNEFSESECWDITFSCLNLMSNSFITGLSGAGTLLFAAAALTGPASAVLFSFGMAVLAATVTMLAAYSLYVDGRFVTDQQLTEIEKGIDFIIQYSREVTAEPVSEDTRNFAFV
ncbi:MAG: hypothetical protein P4L79_08950 [Legionella sp.]|uniref:hypothetical protein n=1 Tax=Legionella sp. TaxID=459 RepID=UPI00284B17BF|nr:hypothetical protein [Legionella sp.]